MAWFTAAQFNQIVNQLVAIQHSLNTLQQGEVTMAADLSVLQAQVTASIGVETSAVTLIKGLAADLLAAQNDPAAIAALAAQLNTSAASLAAAVAANPA